MAAVTSNLSIRRVAHSKQQCGWPTWSGQSQLSSWCLRQNESLCFWRSNILFGNASLAQVCAKLNCFHLHWTNESNGASAVSSACNNLHQQTYVCLSVCMTLCHPLARIHRMVECNGRLPSTTNWQIVGCPNCGVGVVVSRCPAACLIWHSGDDSDDLDAWEWRQHRFTLATRRSIFNTPTNIFIFYLFIIW